MSDFQKYLDEALINVKLDDRVEHTVEEYDILIELRELLVSTRKEMNMSQKQLSESTGIPQANISKFENGHNVPSIQILKRIADGLGKRLNIEFIEPEEVE